MELDEGRLVVVSPHLDDAVFSCGDLLAGRPGSVVITIFAGQPREYGVLTPWDQACGFRDGEDVVAVRRQEDSNALGLLGATPCWLPFLDSQYGRNGDIREVADRLIAAVGEAGAGTVAAPLGLFHSDHVAASEASILAGKLTGGTSWYFYEDALYRADANRVQERVEALRQRGFVLEHYQGPARASCLKRQAVQSYRSQLHALQLAHAGGRDDILRPETYWRVLGWPAEGRAV